MSKPFYESNPELFPNGEEHITDYLLKNKEDGLIFAAHGKNKGVHRPREKDTTIYKKNKSFFRSEEFENRGSGGSTVIFSGCSVTFGEGHDLKDSYAYQVYTQLSKKQKMSGFFNIGVPGATGLQAITSIFDYIEIYGNPDIIIILFPPLERDMSYFIGGPNFFEFQYRDQRDKDLIKQDYEKHVLLFNRVYKMLYLYCKSHGIKLISSHWEEYTDNVHIGNPKISFEGMLELLYPDTYKRIDVQKRVKDLYDFTALNPNLKNLMYAKDGLHQGIAWNHAISKQIIEMFEL